MIIAMDKIYDESGLIIGEARPIVETSDIDLSNYEVQEHTSVIECSLFLAEMLALLLKNTGARKNDICSSR